MQQLPPATHPVWENLITRKIQYKFSLFAANMAIDRAARLYQADASQMSRLAGELRNLFSKYEKLMLPELKRLM